MKIIKNLPMKDYLALDGISRSALKSFSVSPADYAATLEEDKEATDSMIIGSALDCLVFDGREKYEERFCVLPKGMVRNKRHKKYQEWLEENEGKEALKDTDAEAIEEMRENLLKNRWGRAMAEAEPQLTLQWEGYKARPDAVDRKAGVIYDLKTTNSLSEHSLQARVFDFWYDAQAAMDVDGWQAITGEEMDVIWVWVRSKPPCIVEAHRAEDWLEIGRLRYTETARRLRGYRLMDEYPVTSNKLTTLEVPGWINRKFR